MQLSLNITLSLQIQSVEQVIKKQTEQKINHNLRI